MKGAVMWEFSLNVKAENFAIASLLYNALSKSINQMQGVITSNEENGYISIYFCPNSCPTVWQFVWF